MAEARFYTYIHRKADTGDIFYVGKGIGNRCNETTNRNNQWRLVFEKHGRVVEIVSLFECEVDAFAHEKLLISDLRKSGANLVNMTSGGQGQSGRPISNEQKAKISAALKGRRPSDNTLFAARRPPSAEHRAKISQAKKGGKAWNKGVSMPLEERLRRGWPAEKKIYTQTTKARTELSIAHREKISAALKGRPKAPFSDEHRAKMSEAKKRYWAEIREHKQ